MNLNKFKEDITILLCYCNVYSRLAGAPYERERERERIEES